MKNRFITALLIGTMAMSTLSACGNASQETMSPEAEITEETKSAEEEAAEAEAARQEEADAAYEAGRACLYGLDGQEIDREEAYANFSHALELGKTEANFYLGVLCYWYNGWYNVPEQEDYEKAKAYYEAAGDNPYAQLALGLLYANGQGVEKDTAKAQELFDAVIAQGYMEGYVGNARIARNNEDYTAAFEYYNKALEGGEQLFTVHAMNGIASMYYDGLGVEQDYAQAMEWYTKTADLGDTDAMNYIGNMYRMGGLGVEQDYTQAMEWYTKAADLGDTIAMVNVGSLYGEGLGVEQDYAQAMEWYKKAADLGEPTAMNLISYMYDKGLGVEQDSDLAQEWYNKFEQAW